MPEWAIWLAQACIPGLITGVVLAFWNRQQNKKAKSEEEKERIARLKDSLELSLLVATAEMSYAVVMAMKRGSPNGEVEEALKRYNRAMEKFREFEREQLGYVD